MSRTASKPPRAERRRRRERPPRTERGPALKTAAVILALLVFLAGDAALVSVAVNASSPAGTMRTPRPLPTFGAPASPEPPTTGQPAAEQAAGAPATGEPSVRQHLIAAGDATTLWRATSSTCSALTPAPTLDRSPDAGLSWTPLSFDGLDLRSVTSVLAADALTVTITGAVGDACTPSAFTSHDAGDTWDVDPTAAAPQAGATTPPASLAVVGGQLWLWDGDTIRHSGDGGVSWDR